jgi:hypothetical protein
MRVPFLFLSVLFLMNSATETLARQAASREEEIQQAQMRKSESLAPDEPERIESLIESLFIRAMKEIPRFSRIGPVRLQTGGLAEATGFAINPQLLWKNRKDSIRLDLSAAGSTRAFYALRTGMVLPSSVNRQLRFSIHAGHSDAPKLEYYGLGPDSSKGDRTNYRREDTTLDVVMAWHPNHRRWAAGIATGALFVNVGPGRDSRFASSESKYSAAAAPGIDIQTNFIRTTVYTDFDFRDFPGDPHAGNRIDLQYRRYTDFKRDLYTFGRFSANAEQYFPFFNKKRVVSMSGGVELTSTDKDQLVPFYLQPTLGGPDDLTGFRRYRFSDNNLVRFRGEYRWEVSAGFEMALFADAGKVFHKIEQIRLTGLARSAGFGLRFKTRDSVAFRIDTGFSREGFQTWVRFNTALQRSF